MKSNCFPGYFRSVRLILLEGPSTAEEIAISLGIDLPRIRQALWHMRTDMDHVRFCGRIRCGNRKGPRTLKLHKLTPRGLYVAKRQER